MHAPELRQDDPIHTPAPLPTSSHDPVCGMTVLNESQYSTQYEGRTYQFCSQKCQTIFRGEPERYRISPQESEKPHQTAAEPLTVDTQYTCPMHPEIRQIGPGVCPKCGMTLEPVVPELEEQENPELKNFTQRFWWTLPLTIIVTVLAMGGHAFVLVRGPTQNWIELGLATPS